MLGMVNHALQQMVTERLGEEQWDSIRAELGIEERVFVVMRQYPDEITYRIAAAVAGRMGVPLADALGTVGRVSGQHRLAEATRRIRRDTASGRRLAPEMTRSGCFPAVALQMVRIGEESGTLDTLLGRAAEDLEQSVEETVARMTTLLEPAIMLVLGVVMGGVIIALYLPVFRLGSAVA